VPIDRQALRLQLRERRVLQRRDDADVRYGCDGMNRGRLICYRDRRCARNRDHLAALHALGGALLRRAHEYREKQRGKKRVNNQRG
jgi:hypothetical protein